MGPRKVEVIRTSRSNLPQVENALRTLDQLIRSDAMTVEGLTPLDLFCTKYPDQITLIFLQRAKDILASLYEVWDTAVTFHIPEFHKLSKRDKEEKICSYNNNLCISYLIIEHETVDGVPKIVRAWTLDDVYFSQPRAFGNALYPYPEIDLVYGEIVSCSPEVIYENNYLNTLMLYKAKELDCATTE